MKSGPQWANAGAQVARALIDDWPSRATKGRFGSAMAKAVGIDLEYHDGRPLAMTKELVR